MSKNKSLSPCAKLYSLFSCTASHHFGVHTRSVLWEPSLGHLVTNVKWPQRERRILPGPFIKWPVTEALCSMHAWHQHGSVNIENACITSLILYTFVFLIIFFPHCWPQPTQRRKIIGTRWYCYIHSSQCPGKDSRILFQLVCRSLGTHTPGHSTGLPASISR